MKRSEAIKKLSEIIRLHRKATNVVTSIELAEMVLDKAKELGMLPPPTTFQEMDAGLNDVMLRDSSGTVYLRRKDFFAWEAE